MSCPRGTLPVAPSLPPSVRSQDDYKMDGESLTDGLIHPVPFLTSLALLCEVLFSFFPQINFSPCATILFFGAVQEFSREFISLGTSRSTWYRNAYLMTISQEA